MFKKISLVILILFAIVGFVLVVGFIAVRFGWTNTPGIIDTQRDSFLNTSNIASVHDSTQKETPSWENSPEWLTLKAAIIKDEPTINRAAQTAGVPARIIVANLISEQMRFFTDDRESYKKFFAPLQILGSETKFSWGVMGIKEDTAIAIENNLKNVDSPLYLGPTYTHLLDLSTSSPANERFIRLTDQHNHFWNYLYAGLYIAQIEKQWQLAGFDISNRPDIIATLFNVGFANSHPHPDPQSGGAAIPIGNTTWSFGSLAASFYDSSELLDLFPRQ